MFYYVDQIYNEIIFVLLVMIGKTLITLMMFSFRNNTFLLVDQQKKCGLRCLKKIKYVLASIVSHAQKWIQFVSYETKKIDGN